MQSFSIRTTRDAVARPIVKVLVSNHGLDALKIGIRRRGLIGQDVGGIKHIETLVFHGAHVEIVYRHYIVQIQIVLQLQRNREKEQA
jgi:hypothetical protein